MITVAKYAPRKRGILERGRHALAATTKYGANGKDSIAKYAYRVLGVEDGTDDEKHAAYQTVSRQIRADEVYNTLHHVVQPDRYFRQFAEIQQMNHAAIRRC